MNLGDYLLPWKSIPNMIKDVKAAGKTTTEDGKPNYDSVFGAIGKYADPAGALLGDKWMNFWHGTIPREVNRGLEPFTKFNREKMDPIWRFGGKKAMGGDEGDFAKITNTKSGDIAAAIMGLVFGGGALLGGAGAGAGGGAGGASGAGASGASSLTGGAGGWNAAQLGTVNGILPAQGASAGAWTPASAASASGGSMSGAPWNWDWANMDWSNPQTYMQLSQKMPSMQQQQQAPQPPPQLLQLTPPSAQRSNVGEILAAWNALASRSY